jgi:site-specific recombinase XerD
MISELQIVSAVESAVETPASASAPTKASSPINPAAVYLESLGSEISKRTMVSPLNRAACILNPALSGKNAWQAIPWGKLTAPVVRMVMGKLGGSPATRNKALAALKGVARIGWELRLISSDEKERILSIKGDAGSREIAGRYVPTGEVFALLKACAEDNSAAGARDAAMLALTAATGARRAEVASIRAEDAQRPEPNRFEIRIIGKRNKERTLYVVGNAALALADWLAFRDATGCITGPLFCAIRKGGAVMNQCPVSTTALDKILAKRSRQANVSNLDWHDLRRTTASNLLDAGADIATVAGILGHSNIQTTARYDRRGERAKIKASELVSVPYFGKRAA